MEKQVEITIGITQALRGVPSLESYQLLSGVASGQSPEKTWRAPRASDEEPGGKSWEALREEGERL